jgi:ribulose-phosphate 3-epimerase
MSHKDTMKKQRILPSIMATSQKDVNTLFKKLDGLVQELHLDVGDGRFVQTKVLDFPLSLSSKFSYNAHLMVQDPGRWIKRFGSRVKKILFHPEPLSNSQVSGYIDEIHDFGGKAGLALRPETKVSDVKKYLADVEYVLILTVHPGFYGAKYLKAPLKKIQQIKKINPSIEVIVDGGMTPETIGDAAQAGADYFVSGSYVTKAEDPRKAIRELETKIK